LSIQASIDRQREELLTQCDRAARDINLACDHLTARLDNQCNELNARTMSAQDAQMSVFEQRRTELQRRLNEMNMYQELALQLLDESRSSAEVVHYAPTLMNSMRASMDAMTENAPNEAGGSSVETLEFIPADVTGLNLLGTLVMTERETGD